MTALYLITADTLVCGAFDGHDEQDARDKAAQDAGYDDEADIANRSARDWSLWAERIDPNATHTREQWDGMHWTQRRDVAARTIVACR